MLKNILFIIILLFTIYSCKSKRVNISKTNYSSLESNIQNFKYDFYLLKGKWLTNSRFDNKNYVVFQENFFARYDDGRNVPYQLKMDSIFIFFKKMTAVGKIINLTQNEIDVVWGEKEPKERIKYYRP